ncbi:MAG: UDP-N-acetylmuramoyl-L-alanyl-D-glutamate--2,6-diaminopimelate ligase [Frankiaceae bacterium]|jgi:UDP-N-acetylmuramoyl-L-alanyl-D-glutamate--2,6-diaminopimelate ligase|nr:UDP-N-acetylmuramoyl-L-alanyl-D-glutamate--2,6-diaminopimelate ligase [Frankiaceae bacterium]
MLPAMPRPAGQLPRPLRGWRSEAPDVSVSGVTHDSREVRPGDVYAALPGSRAHGADFATQAAAAGAVAMLSDVDSEALPTLVVPDPRKVLGDLARWVYGDPSAAMDVIGVTGTNGKTTTGYLLDAGLTAAGRTTGLIGTVETRIAGERLDSAHTTPEAPDLQALLAVMRERGVTGVGMEVSSHGLALGRVDGTTFAAAIFTNLSQDHLDFHADMESYFKAKAALFTPERAKVAVINVDDPYGARLVERSRLPVVTTSATGARLADWQAHDVALSPDGVTFRVVAAGLARDVRLRLPAAYNVANALGALAALVSVGIDADAAIAGVESLPGVPGRLERIDRGQPFLAVVDYAHTPDSVASVLAAVRPFASGRVIVVVGCGGDRDAAKRPLMGAAAARGADLVVATSDNPRSEDPLAILDAMVSGIRDVGTTPYIVEPDRAAAIRVAVASAGPGDVIVVAGKGHEQGQESGGVTVPFDDRLVLAEALS